MDTARDWMSAIRRFVIWVLAIAVVGACALLAPAVGVTDVGSVEQPLALIPAPNTGLPGIKQVAATADQGYADYLKENEDVSPLVELSPPRSGLRHLVTVSFDKTPTLSANLVAVSNLVGLRMTGSKQALNAVGLLLGQVSGTGDRVRSQNPVVGTQISTGSAIRPDSAI